MCFAGDMRRKHHVEKGQLIIKTCRRAIIICAQKMNCLYQKCTKHEPSVPKMLIICTKKEIVCTTCTKK
jgi:hypothetical protein